MLNKSNFISLTSGGGKPWNIQEKREAFLKLPFKFIVVQIIK